MVRESTCQLREEGKEPEQNVLSKACSRNGDTGPRVGRSLGQEEGAALGTAAGQQWTVSEGTAAGEELQRGPDSPWGVTTCPPRLLGPQLHVHALTDCQVSNFF